MTMQEIVDHVSQDIRYSLGGGAGGLAPVIANADDCTGPPVLYRGR